MQRLRNYAPPFDERRGAACQCRSDRSAAGQTRHAGLKQVPGQKEGIPGIGKLFPDGAIMAKIEWFKKENPVSSY